MIAMDNRDRLAPIALSRKEPVSQLICRLRFANALFFQPLDHFIDRLLLAKTIQPFRIDMDTIFCERFLFDIATFQNRNDRKPKLFRELIIPRIMSRNRHDRTRTIACKNVIRNIDRDLLAIDRIDRISAREYTRLVFVQICTL